jgi:hypothetical protein
MNGTDKPAAALPQPSPDDSLSLAHRRWLREDHRQSTRDLMRELVAHVRALEMLPRPGDFER